MTEISFPRVFLLGAFPSSGCFLCHLGVLGQKNTETLWSEISFIHTTPLLPATLHCGTQSLKIPRFTHTAPRKLSLLLLYLENIALPIFAYEFNSTDQREHLSHIVEKLQIKHNLLGMKWTEKAVCKFVASADYFAPRK